MLSRVPRVLVQEEHVYGDACCCNTGNKQYFVTDANNTQNRFYVGVETLDNCCRQCGCLCRRDFDIVLKDQGNQQAAVITHGRTCCNWFSCCECCRHRFEVKRNGQLVGRVTQDCEVCCNCYPSFTVTNAKDQTLYRVTKDINCCQQMCGPACDCCCCSCHFPTGYTVKSKGKDGSIEKLPDRRDEDTFEVLFPPESDEDGRLLIVASSFLADYALYDGPKGPKKQQMK